MARTRVSTTVDEDLLREARRILSKLNDAALLDEALEALVTKHRETEFDNAYLVYDELPIEEPDEWGGLASFRHAAGSSWWTLLGGGSCGCVNCRR